MSIRSRLLHSVRSFLARHFKRIQTPEKFEPICKNPDRFIVVMQSDSIVLESLLLSFARRNGIEETAMIGTETSPPSSTQIRWVSLQQEHCLDELSRTHPEACLVTLNTFPIRGPARRTPNYSISFWQGILLLVRNRSTHVMFGDPIPPDVWKTKKSITRLLRLHFYKDLKLVRGIPFQHISSQERIVLSGSEYQREIQILSQRTGQSPRTLHSRARKVFRTIAANPLRPLYGIAACLAKFLVRNMFTEVITKGLDELKSAVRKDTVVIVPMHRSHFDYLLLGSELYRAKLNTPLVAAGINLAFWPAGFLIRSVGGFFVKRGEQSDRLYALTFRRYVSYLTKRGHAQEFFIEGGRSRSGRMRRPKLGLLSIYVKAYLKGMRRDILFVPTSITYERVVEDSAFGTENTGAAKEKETLMALLKAHRVFTKKYSEVIIRFGSPLSLSEFSEQWKNTNGQPPREREFVHALGFELTERISSQADISLTGLAFTALMASPAYGLQKETLISAVQNLARLATAVGISEPKMAPSFTPSLTRFLEGESHRIHDFGRGDLVEKNFCAGLETFAVRGQRRFTADFYKNSTVHIYLPVAILATAELLDSYITLERIRQLYELFRYDYILPEQDRFLESIQSLMQELTRGDILTLENEQAVFKSRESGLFIPTLVQAPIQSLLWVALTLNSHTRSHGSPLYDEDEFHATLQRDFKSARYRGILTRTEAGAHSALQGAIDSLKQRGFLTYEPSTKDQRNIKLLVELDEEIALLQEVDSAIRSWQLQELQFLNVC